MTTHSDRKPRKRSVDKRCGLLCWSLKGKNGKIRPEVCPECGKPARVGTDMLGRACFFHDREKAS